MLTPLKSEQRIADELRYIGAPVPRPNALRLLQGRGVYVDDIVLPRMAHVVYWRSPIAHGRITSFDASFAMMMPGVIGVFGAEDIADICTPWVGTLAHLPGMKSPPQYPLAPGHLCWQGEPVFAVVAETRHQAEDALAYLRIEWDELPVVANMERALDPDSPLIHPELGDNLCLTRTIDNGSVDATFASADVVVEESYRFGRHTGVTMETRSVLADFNAAEHTLTVYHSHQAPHMMQDLYSRHLNLPEASVRVICKDVGGSFGIKVHSYPDDFATVALSKLLKRPIKFIADRLESFVSDVHARDHLVKARLAATKDGRILAFEIDDLTGVGPYSVYPRTSGIEGNQVLNITGGPYQHANYRARLRVVFQNKPPMSQYRGVGHPIACAVTEGIVDLAASTLGIDPLVFRKMNVMHDDAYPRTGASGIKLEGLSHDACLSALKEWPTMTGFATSNVVYGATVCIAELVSLQWSNLRIPARHSMASVVRASRRRTGQPSVWMPVAALQSWSALESRAKGARPSSPRLLQTPFRCQSAGSASLQATRQSRRMVAERGHREGPASVVRLCFRRRTHWGCS